MKITTDIKKSVETLGKAKPDSITLSSSSKSYFNDDATEAQAKETVNMIHTQSKGLVLSGDDDKGVAVEILTNTQTALKRFEQLRKMIVSPMNDKVKDVNAYFKKFTDPLKASNEGLRGKVLVYEQRMEAERIRKERILEEEKAALEASQSQRDPEEQEAVEEIIEKKEEEVKSLEREKTQHFDAGKVTVKKIWTHEVEDVNLVPREYMVVDDKLIKAAIKNGEREITGVKIYQKDRISL